MNCVGYQTDSFYDEIFFDDYTPRPEAMELVDRIEGLPEGELVRRHAAAAMRFFA